MARKVKRPPMSEINVVPYIDVMLVLLVIFMISTPLLTQGVKVDLPQQETQNLELEQSETIIAKVDKSGNFYLTIGTGKEESVSGESLIEQVRLVIAEKPKTTVLVAGDEASGYGQVMNLLALLSRAGVPDVGLMTKPLDP